MLNIYTSPNPEDIVTTSNQIISAHDLSLGSWNTMKLYVRNSDNTKYYTNVEIRLDIESNPTENGNVYLLRKGNVEPTAIEWGNTELLTEIEMEATIGSEEEANTESYFPFFLRVYIPADASIGFSTECNLIIVAIQEPVSI